MVYKLLKKGISLAMAFAALLSLSCCGVGDEVLIDEITAAEATSCEAAETTPEETTAASLSEEELDALAQNMPEIVFVYSFSEEIYEHIFGRNENIFGYYVTNTGEIKIFDFREIAPDEVYDISDVYDRLEEATCDGIYIRNHGEIAGKKKISEDDITPLSQDELIDCYKRLLLIEDDAEFIQHSVGPDVSGCHILYGIRNNDKGEKECIILSGLGYGEMFEYKNKDPNANYISGCLDVYKHFPDLYFQDWSIWPKP